MRVLWVWMCMCITFIGYSQSLDSPVELDAQYESLAETVGDSEDPDLQEHLEYLEFLRLHPLNLNGVSRADLERIFFLSDRQIENLLFYLYVNGSMMTVYELQLVEAMDQRTISRLMPYVVVLPNEGKKQFMKGFALARWRSLLETSSGYRVASGDNQPSYVGTKDRCLVRTAIESNRFRAGFVAEKDAGEAWWRKSVKAPDFFGGYVQWMGRNLGTSFLAGHYRGVFGQGLSLCMGQLVSPVTDPVSMRIRQRSFYGTCAADEDRYLSGFASIVKVSRRIHCYPFISYRRRDAALNPDSLTYASFPSSGLHRTHSELENQDRAIEFSSGSVIETAFDHCRLEAGWFSYQIDKPYQSGEAPYQLYRFSGQRSDHMWFAHQANLSGIIWFGELACFQYNSLGLVQGLCWDPGNQVSASVKIQHFNKGFYSPYMNLSFKSGAASGETGISTGWQFVASSHFRINLYYLFSHYSWLRYQVDAPSERQESFLRMVYQVNERFLQTLQLKARWFEKNDDSEHSPSFSTSAVRQINLRYQAELKPVSHWSLMFRIENCQYETRGQRSSGWAFVNDIRFTPANQRYSFLMRWVHFDARDYNCRIYTYEPDVFYGYSVPALSGQGTRIVFNAWVDVMKRMRCYFRYSASTYDNVNEIGSGNECISGPRKSEVTLQWRLRF